MTFNRRVSPRAPCRHCTIWSLQLLPCSNRTFDYFLFMCTHMIAKLFSEACEHKSCIHKLKQHSCFLSSLCSVAHQRRLCIANRTNLWGSFAIAFGLSLFSLCCSVSPPRAPSARLLHLLCMIYEAVFSRCASQPARSLVRQSAP